jgi:glutathione reductase (NADPH)
MHDLIVVGAGCQVLAVEHDAVRYQDAGERPSPFLANCIVNATARAPAVEDIGLEQLGVDFSARGVRVDDRGRTNVPGAFHEAGLRVS